MAKATTIKIRLVSSADTGYFYVAKKNSRLAVRVWKRTDGSGIGMDYDLVKSHDGEILVDHGFIRATRLPNGKCRVESQKTVAFSNLPIAAGAACVADFWPKVMQKMGECKGEAA